MKKKVLIIEDDEFLSVVVRKKLETEGYEVVSVFDGAKAEEALADTDIGLVLLDIMLPHKDGFDILKDIKAQSKYKDLPVVMFTNLSDPEDMKLCKEQGAEDYIVKSANQLAHVVKVVDELMKSE